MEYNDFDFLMILSLYKDGITLDGLLYHLEGSGGVDEDAYYEAIWLVAQMEQDGLVRTNGQDDALALRLTPKGRALCERIADAMATDVENQWRQMQPKVSPPAA